MTSCFKCGLEIDTTVRPGRSDTCLECDSDVKVCLNCRFHDEASYNECREGQAERVVDKVKSNFCEYFEFGDGGSAGNKKAAKDPLAKLKDIFGGK